MRHKVIKIKNLCYSCFVKNDYNLDNDYDKIGLAHNLYLEASKNFKKSLIINFLGRCLEPKTLLCVCI